MHDRYNLMLGCITADCTDSNTRNLCNKAIVTIVCLEDSERNI
jgi:hypothetical protein